MSRLPCWRRPVERPSSRAQAPLMIRSAGPGPPALRSESHRRSLEVRHHRAGELDE
jgi:hypothetical protein